MCLQVWACVISAFELSDLKGAKRKGLHWREGERHITFTIQYSYVVKTRIKPNIVTSIIFLRHYNFGAQIQKHNEIRGQLYEPIFSFTISQSVSQSLNHLPTASLV